MITQLTKNDSLTTLVAPPVYITTLSNPGPQGPQGTQGPTGDVTPEALQARDDAQLFAENADESAQAAALDALATAGDRVQTGLDRIATGDDRIQTGLDAIASSGYAASAQGFSEAAELDAQATGADRIQTGLDAASALQSKLDAEAASLASINLAENLDATVTTLAEGASATVDYDNQTYLLSFGIPKGDTGLTGATGATGSQGPQGDDGLSAYEVAVAQGYPGTEQQWLESLVGTDGQSYPPYVSDTPPTDTAANPLWLNSVTATMYFWYDDGDSSQWVAISGASGTSGTDGADAPTYERRHDYVAPYSYCGKAPEGTLVSASGWTLTRIEMATDGTTTTTHASDSWDNRLTATYG